jgi:hypothetical protein
VKQRHAGRGRGADRLLEIAAAEVGAEIAGEIVADERGLEREKTRAAEGLAAGVVQGRVEGARGDEDGEVGNRLGEGSVRVGNAQTLPSGIDPKPCTVRPSAPTASIVTSRIVARSTGAPLNLYGVR